MTDPISVRQLVELCQQPLRPTPHDVRLALGFDLVFATCLVTFTHLKVCMPYSQRNRMADLTSFLYKIGSKTTIFSEVK